MNTLASVVAIVLAAHTHHVFGVMGEGNAAFVSEVEGQGVPVTPVRHESAAIAAADIYFRASGKLAVASSTYGAGFTNTLTTLVESAKAHIPLIYVTGGKGAPKPWDVDEVAVLSALNIPFVVLTTDVASQVSSAVQQALAESTPVVIIITDGMATIEVAPASEVHLQLPENTPAPIDEEFVAQVESLLTNATNPLILGGRGVWMSGSHEIYTDIATRLGARLATTAAANGMFGEHGRICGGFADEATAELIHKADVVLAVGASLNPFTMRFGKAFNPDATVIQIAADSKFNPRANLTSDCDAGQLGSALLEKFNERDQRDLPAYPPRHDDLPEVTDGRAHPADISQAIGEVLPRQSTIVSDGGHFIGWPAMYWTSPDPAGFLQIGTAFKAIGMGTGGALGAAYARPDRTTVLVTGDGGLQMALADLVSLAYAPGQRIVVVINDGAYGAELHQFAPLDYSLTMARLGTPDFAELGRALGGHGITMMQASDATEIASWIEENPDGFLIIDAQVSPTVCAPFFQEIVNKNLGK